MRPRKRRRHRADAKLLHASPDDELFEVATKAHRVVIVLVHDACAQVTLRPHDVQQASPLRHTQNRCDLRRTDVVRATQLPLRAAMLRRRKSHGLLIRVSVNRLSHGTPSRGWRHDAPASKSSARR